MNGKRWFDGSVLFGMKDIVSPSLRNPRAYVLRHGYLASCSLGGLAILVHYSNAGVFPTWGNGVGVALLICMVASALAFFEGLPCLGREGLQLFLLRPFVDSRNLIAWKTTAVVAFCVSHAVCHCLWIVGLATALGLHGLPSPAFLVSLSAAAGAGSALLACAIGFLLPDIRRRSVFLPGASVPGRALFTALAAYGSGTVAAVFVLTQFHPELEPLAGLAMLVLLAIAGLALAIAIIVAPQRLFAIEWR